MDAVRRSVDVAGSRWLVITEEAIVPSDSGGRAESLSMVKAISAHGIDLHVLVPGIGRDELVRHRHALPGVSVQSLPRRPGIRSHLGRIPYVVASRPVPRDLTPALRRLHDERPFTAVVALTFRVAHIGEAAAAALDLPLLVRPHNVESAYFEDLASSSGGVRRLAYRREAARLRRAEESTHRSSRITMFADISDSDARLRREATSVPVRYEPPFLPVTVPAQAAGEHPTGTAPQRVLFVGSMDNANNRSAVRWFVENCLPALDGRADLQVVGRRIPAELHGWLTDRGVDVVPDAPSMEPHLRSASVFVNPMQRGSGVNIKMIDAVVAGLPVVTTTSGARGIPWRDGEHVLVRDDPGDFGAAVVALLDDPGRRRALAGSGREFVLDLLAPDRRIADLRSALEGPLRPIPHQRADTELALHPGDLR